MTVLFENDIKRGLEFVPGGPPKLASRGQLEQVIRDARLAGYGAAYRTNEEGSDGCLGCLFSFANGIYGVLTDFSGKKAEAEKVRVFNEEVDSLENTMMETIPVIETGLEKMRKNVSDFVEALPAGSTAKRVVEEYDAACFCEPFELENGVKVVLLRGEYKKHYSDLTHRGGNKEEVYMQSGVMVTNEGDFFKVELQGMSLSKDREPKLGSAMEIREFVMEYRKRDAFLSELSAVVKRAKDDKDGVRLVPTDQLYFNKKHRLDIQKLDIENDAGDQKKLRNYLLASQKRALIVGLSLGKKEMGDQKTRSQEVLFPGK